MDFNVANKNLPDLLVDKKEVTEVMGLARVGVGTVQMGVDYGVSNFRGKVTDDGARKIFIEAARLGVTLLDTAHHYGDSEAMLGNNLPDEHRFNVVTKTISLSANTLRETAKSQLLSSFSVSLKKLNLDSVYGLLIHHIGDLKGPFGDLYLEGILDLKASGAVKKIGVSVYDGDDIEFVLSKFTPDIVQLPISVADQRLLKSGHLSMLKALDVEIHARSLFLQGLLLMDLDAIPSGLQPVLPQLTKIRSAAHEAGCSALELCLLFGLSLEELDYLVLGVTSLVELAEINKVVTSSQHVSLDFGSLLIENEFYLSPANWKLS